MLGGSLDGGAGSAAAGGGWMGYGCVDAVERRRPQRPGKNARAWSGGNLGAGGARQRDGDRGRDRGVAGHQRPVARPVAALPAVGLVGSPGTRVAAAGLAGWQARRQANSHGGTTTRGAGRGAWRAAAGVGAGGGVPGADRPWAWGVPGGVPARPGGAVGQGRAGRRRRHRGCHRRAGHPASGPTLAGGGGAAGAVRVPGGRGDPLPAAARQAGGPAGTASPGGGSRAGLRRGGRGPARLLAAGAGAGGAAGASAGPGGHRRGGPDRRAGRHLDRGWAGADRRADRQHPPRATR